MSPYPVLRADLDNVLQSLSSGHCVSVVGLSNMGKTTRLRRFVREARAAERYTALCGRAVQFVFVDCNRMVELTVQGLYEVILRSMLEVLPEDGELATTSQQYYERVAGAATVFQASLNFNEAVTLLAETLPEDLVLILDEFDDVYGKLDNRMLLNLRAFHERYGQKLMYLTATNRRLGEIRGVGSESEFSELFANAVFYVGPFDAAESERMLRELAGDALDDETARFVVAQSGGHPGLLEAVYRAVLRVRRADSEYHAGPHPSVDGDMIVRGESVKLWNQLAEDEREALIALSSQRDAALPRTVAQQLRRYGIINDGAFFSEQFESFVQRQSNVPSNAPTGVFIDHDSGEVWVDGQRVPLLTDLEHKLLSLLGERRDKLTDKFQIVQAVWGDDYIDQVDDARIEKLVSRLRSKVEPDGANPRYILTVRGRGYRLVSRPMAE